MIFVNQLIDYNLEPVRKERVLWLNSEENTAYVINILNNKSLPEKRLISDLLTDLTDGVAIISSNDPFVSLIDDNSISDKNKLIRNNRWNLIKDIVNIEPDIYISRKRGIILNNLVKETKTTLKQIYKLLRLYWCRGMTKNSLLPDYKNSGGKGVRKTVGTKKLGRPRKYKEVIGNGIVIDESIEYIFKISAEKFYLNKKENPLTLWKILSILKIYLELLLNKKATKWLFYMLLRFPIISFSYLVPKQWSSTFKLI